MSMWGGVDGWFLSDDLVFFWVFREELFYVGCWLICGGFGFQGCVNVFVGFMDLG